MPRGGYRPGSGRKPSGLTSKTREIAERAIAEGETPLEVMLNNMRFYHRKAGEALAKLAGSAPRLEFAGGEEAGEPDAKIIEAIREVLELRKLAGAEAARAAPYVHPRMGYASVRTDDDIIPLNERLREYARRDSLQAAGLKVIELKRRSDRRADPSASEPFPPPVGPTTTSARDQEQITAPTTPNGLKMAEQDPSAEYGPWGEV